MPVAGLQAKGEVSKDAELTEQQLAVAEKRFLLPSAFQQRPLLRPRWFRARRQLQRLWRGPGARGGLGAVALGLRAGCPVPLTGFVPNREDGRRTDGLVVRRFDSLRGGGGGAGVSWAVCHLLLPRAERGRRCWDPPGARSLAVSVLLFVSLLFCRVPLWLLTYAKSRVIKHIVCQSALPVRISPLRPPRAAFPFSNTAKQGTKYPI